MAIREVRDDAKRLPRPFRQRAPDYFVRVLVSLHYQVGVVAEYGACPYSIAKLCGASGETVSVDVPHRLVKPDNLVLQQRLGLRVKGLEFAARRLLLFSAGMDFSQFCEKFFADFVGSAAAEVVGEPVSVAHQNQVMGNDDAVAGAMRNHGLLVQRGPRRREATASVPLTISVTGVLRFSRIRADREFMSLSQHMTPESIYLSRRRCPNPLSAMGSTVSLRVVAERGTRWPHVLYRPVFWRTFRAVSSTYDRLHIPPSPLPIVEFATLARTIPPRWLL
jgi:hypothetical protein